MIYELGLLWLFIPHINKWKYEYKDERAVIGEARGECKGHFTLEPRGHEKNRFNQL